MRITSENLLIIGILTTALIIRLAFVIGWSDKFDIYPDSNQYLRVAENILNGKGFILSEGSRASRAPLYPLFCAGVEWLVGESRAGIRILQTLISVATVYLVFRIASGVGGICGIISACLATIFPYLTFYTGIILTETLFVFLILCLCLSSFEGGAKGGVLAGLLSGLCTLIRPSMLFFPFFLSIAFLRKGKAWLGAVWGAYLLTLAPWVLRNYLVLGELIPGTTLAGASLYEANSDPALIAGGGPAMHLIRWERETEGMTEVQKDRYYRRKALRWIREHPKEFLTLVVKKQMRFWSPVPNNPLFRGWKYALPALVSFLVVTLAGVAGLFLFREPGVAFNYSLALLVYLVLLHSVFVGSIRYRLPLEALFCIHAGILYGIAVRRKLCRQNSA